MAPTKTPEAAVIRPLRADARRNKTAVLTAARRLFADEGFEAQIDDIARLAGVGVGTVYRHYPTKEDLIAALAEDRFAFLAERAREALAEDDPTQAFRSFLQAAAELQVGDSALSHVMTDRPEMMAAAAQRAGMLELMSDLVGKAQAAGGLRPDFRGEDVGMIVCGLGKITQIGQTVPHFRWDRLLAIILDGLRSPGPSQLPD